MSYPTEEQARAEAYEHVAALVERLSNGTMVRAEELANEVIRDPEVEVMEMDGDLRYEPPGVRLVLRIDPNHRSETLFPALCFDVWFESAPVVWPKDNRHSMTEVECAEGEPLDLERPAPPLWGAANRLEGLLAEALTTAGGIPDPADVEAAVAELELDPLVHVEIEYQDGMVGVALRYGYTHACVQARLWPEHLEVWEHSPFELGFSPLCTASSAFLGRSGIES